MKNAPTYEIDLPAFTADPYPDLEILRRKAPVAYVPQLDAVLLVLHDDITASEKNTNVFSSDQPAGLMNTLMGQNLMRKDGKTHSNERKILAPTLTPKAVRHSWTSVFQQHCDELLQNLPNERGADLVSHFAMPLSAEALKSLTGLTDVDASLLDHWSQSMIDGIANYADDAKIKQACLDATSAIDSAIDRQIDRLNESPDHSLLSLMLDANLVMDSVRANIKLMISGGQNEPRDAIAGTVWALLKHPQQLKLIRTGHATWQQAFAEYIRWISPIGMSPRRIATEHMIRKVLLEPDDKVFFMFSSANRDSQYFDHADQFDIQRDTRAHIAFGAGPHFCMGAAASRALIADVALPGIFSRLQHLAIDANTTIKQTGWAFRGLTSLPCHWT